MRYHSAVMIFLIATLHSRHPQQRLRYLAVHGIFSSSSVPFFHLPCSHRPQTPPLATRLDTGVSAAPSSTPLQGSVSARYEKHPIADVSTLLSRRAACQPLPLPSTHAHNSFITRRCGMGWPFAWGPGSRINQENKHGVKSWSVVFARSWENPRVRLCRIHHLGIGRVVRCPYIHE